MNINQDSNAVIQNAINQLNAQKQQARASAYNAKYAELKPTLDKSIEELQAQLQKAIAEVQARFNQEIARAKEGVQTTANKYADEQVARYDLKISQLQNMIEV